MNNKQWIRINAATVGYASTLGSASPLDKASFSHSAKNLLFSCKSLFATFFANTVVQNSPNRFTHPVFNEFNTDKSNQAINLGFKLEDILNVFFVKHKLSSRLVSINQAKLLHSSVILKSGFSFNKQTLTLLSSILFLLLCLKIPVNIYSSLYDIKAIYILFTGIHACIVSAVISNLKGSNPLSSVKYLVLALTTIFLVFICSYYVYPFLIAHFNFIFAERSLDYSFWFATAGGATSTLDIKGSAISRLFSMSSGPGGANSNLPIASVSSSSSSDIDEMMARLEVSAKINKALADLAISKLQPDIEGMDNQVKALCGASFDITSKYTDIFKVNHLSKKLESECKYLSLTGYDLHKYFAGAFPPTSEPVMAINGVKYVEQLNSVGSKLERSANKIIAALEKQGNKHKWGCEEDKNTFLEDVNNMKKISLNTKNKILGSMHEFVTANIPKK